MQIPPFGEAFNDFGEFDDGRAAGLVQLKAIAVSTDATIATVWFPREPEEEVQGWSSSMKLVLWLVAHSLWIRRKQAEDDHKHSWKWLIFQGSLLTFFITPTLLSALSSFSDGEAWLGALYLAVALLLGSLAVYTFIEVLKAFRRRREDAAREHRLRPPD